MRGYPVLCICIQCTARDYHRLCHRCEQSGGTGIRSGAGISAKAGSRAAVTAGTSAAGGTAAGTGASSGTGASGNGIYFKYQYEKISLSVLCQCGSDERIQQAGLYRQPGRGDCPGICSVQKVQSIDGFRLNGPHMKIDEQAEI